MITGFAGLQVSYEMEQRNSEGRLIYREASVMFPSLPAAPSPPTSPCPDCVEGYKEALDRWVEECKGLADFYKAVHEYHTARAGYCARHRNEEIEDRYRTGEPSPQTLNEARAEIKKLRR